MNHKCASEIARAFDTISCLYTNREWYNFFRDLDKNLVRKYISDKCYDCALDMGSGPGSCLDFLAENAKEIVCVDISREMLRTVQSKRLIVEQADTCRCSIHECQGMSVNLPFRDGVFDLVIVLRTLSVIPAWKETIDEICRTMRSWGKLLICDFSDRLNKTHIKYFDNSRKTEVGIPLHLREPDEIREHLIQKSFEKVDIAELGKEQISEFYDTDAIEELRTPTSILYIVSAHKKPQSLD